MEKKQTDAMIAFRLPSALVTRLDALAAKTDRTRSEVLRELLRRAELAETPDVILAKGDGPCKEKR